MQFVQGSAEPVHFLEGFLGGKLGEIFVFCAVVVTVFCILTIYLLLLLLLLLSSSLLLLLLLLLHLVSFN